MMRPLAGCLSVRLFACLERERGMYHLSSCLYVCMLACLSCSPFSLTRSHFLSHFLFFFYSPLQPHTVPLYCVTLCAALLALLLSLAPSLAALPPSFTGCLRSLPFLISLYDPPHLLHLPFYSISCFNAFMSSPSTFLPH